MGSHRTYITEESTESADARPKGRPYSENEALSQAQKRYYEKNKEEQFKHNS